MPLPALAALALQRSNARAAVARKLCRLAQQEEGLLSFSHRDIVLLHGEKMARAQRRMRVRGANARAAARATMPALARNAARAVAQLPQPTTATTQKPASLRAFAFPCHQRPGHQSPGLNDSVRRVVTGASTGSKR
ncbi:hypothetical protein, partial [Xanthomonas oryzae]